MPCDTDRQKHGVQTDTPRLTASLLRKLELSIHVVNYICVHKRQSELKPKIQHIGTWIGRNMTAPLPVLSPNSIRPPPSSRRPFPKIKIRREFKKIII